MRFGAVDSKYLCHIKRRCVSIAFFKFIRMKERCGWKRWTRQAVAPSSFLASTAATDSVENVVSKSPHLGKKKSGRSCKTGLTVKEDMKTQICLTVMPPGSVCAESAACWPRKEAAAMRPQPPSWAQEQQPTDPEPHQGHPSSRRLHHMLHSRSW